MYEKRLFCHFLENGSISFLEILQGPSAGHSTPYEILKKGGYRPRLGARALRRRHIKPICMCLCVCVCVRKHILYGTSLGVRDRGLVSKGKMLGWVCSVSG